MKRNIITLKDEFVDPIDEMMFDVVQVSGQFEYHRGEPVDPRQCCGKNVTFTPVNITANLAFIGNY